MNMFSLVISIIGLLGMPMALVFIFLGLVFSKWRSTLKISLAIFCTSLGCLIIGFISYVIIEPKNVDYNNGESHSYQSSENKISETNSPQIQNELDEQTSVEHTFDEQAFDEHIFEESPAIQNDETNQEDALRIAIENIVGADMLVDFIYLPENNYTLITFRGSDSLTTNLIVEAAYLDIKDILKSLQPVIDTDVRICVTFPIIDVYGNSEEQMVIKADYTLNTIQSINFDNFVSENIPLVADTWWNDELFVISE